MNHMDSPKSYAQNGEDILAWEYFGRKCSGYFVEVGANDPTRLSQSWFFEQRGWTGILIEPLPTCCDALRLRRPNSRVVQAAAGASEGEAVLNIATSDAWSHIGEAKDVPIAMQIPVKIRTLERILREADAPPIDILSIDTEGSELNVLRGLNLQKNRPALILVEDHMDNLDVYFFLKRAGYKLAKRTAPNNWWIPRGAPPISQQLLERASLLNLLWFRKPRQRLRWLLSRFCRTEPHTT